MGEAFSVASWAPKVGVESSGLANLADFGQRVAARPAMQPAMKEEGLLKQAWQPLGF